ncbi:MAG: glycosyltransferase [Candidatus Bathyarchaeia archaeon]|jgi:cellulose synthase/poly-beta-1,6-N-acetylglucosamine synthase-like glycosyltransferase
MIITWFLFGLLALGPAAFIYVYGRKSSKKSWPTKVDPNYRPTISILVPTYNESSIIFLKLLNLSRVNYPANLAEIILVDSNSSDNTVETAKQFIQEKPQMNLRILVEKERRGKSHALNYALSQCKGEVVIVSDADCFWPSDILEKAVPFLADPDVGAIGGPKIILNSNETWVTRMEQDFLKSSNALRLGESIDGSTPFFEGGFIALKRGSFDRFDPYCTGSDDNGTAVNVIERNFRAMFVPKAGFYSPFPTSLKSKLNVKLRRANQLIRIFAKYLSLFAKGKLKNAKKTLVPNIMLYLFSPSAFVIFLILTVFLAYDFPYLLLFLTLLAVPRVRFYSYEIFESNVLLFLAMFGVAVGGSFSIWNQPDDRACISRKKLNQLNLI